MIELALNFVASDIFSAVGRLKAIFSRTFFEGI